MRIVFPETNGDKDVPLKYQRAIMGLNRQVLRGLKGRRALDVGCGDGQLVEFLRRNGVLAEGIDSRAPNKIYFMKRNIGFNEREGFPTGKEYSLVTAFQNPVLNQGVGNGARVWLKNRGIPLGVLPQGLIFSEYDAGCRLARQMLSGMGDILASGGRAIVYPALIEVGKEVDDLLMRHGLEMLHERIEDRAALRDYLKWEGHLNRYANKLADTPDFGCRTVLTKKHL